MKLSRFFVAGALLPVMLGANGSKAEGCTGRFYVGMSFGAEFGKMRYTQKPGDQYDVFPEVAPVGALAPYGISMGGAPDDLVVLPRGQLDVVLPKFPKKMSSFTGDVEIGGMIEMDHFGVGLALNFGKRFGTVKEKMNAKLVKYDKVSDEPTAILRGVNHIEPDHPFDEKPAGEEEMREWGGRRSLDNAIYEKKLKYNTKDVTEIKLKNKYNVTITPILEYKANSMFGVYVTGGIRISSDKVTYNETDGATKKVTKFQKTKTSVAPVVGGGILVNLSEHMYAKAQYLYQFGSKIKKTITRKLNDKKNAVTPTVKYRSQKVTVGFGYMF